MKAGLFRLGVNLWPPLFFSGIRAKSISHDYRHIEVSLKLHWYNRNYFGTHFGGSLFSMTDPWYLLMFTKNLGRDYFVWDKQASIEFISPGRGRVTAKFNIDDAILEDVKAHTANGEKYLPQFHVEIFDEEQKLVARVHRTVYVRRKPGR